MAANMIRPSDASAPVALSHARAVFDAAVRRYQRALAAHYAAIENEAAVLSRFHAARTELPAEFSRWPEGSPKEAAAQECHRKRGVKEAEAALARAVVADCRAFDALLAAPAPDLQGVIVKLELAIAEERLGEAADPVLADLRRLDGEI